MIESISISKIYSAVDGEISQADNLNAYTKLLLLSCYRQVAKVCYKEWDLWGMNLVNLQLICNQISKIDFPEIVFPISFLEHEGDVVGYLMPYIEGKTLDEIITSQLVSPRDILTIFNRISSVIEKLPKNIHLGDLHSGNIIVTKDGNVFFVDVDGFSVDDGYMMTCPLNFDRICSNNLPRSKYFNKDNSVKIGRDTDIYCLLEMFLVWLLDGINPFMFSKKRFLLFLEYLIVKGIPQPIVNMICRAREKKDNYLFPSPFLCFDGALYSISYKDFLNVMNLWEEESKYEQRINKLIGSKKDHGEKVLSG